MVLVRHGASAPAVPGEPFAPGGRPRRSAACPGGRAAGAGRIGSARRRGTGRSFRHAAPAHGADRCPARRAIAGKPDRRTEPREVYLGDGPGRRAAHPRRARRSDPQAGAARRSAGTAFHNVRADGWSLPSAWRRACDDHRGRDGPGSLGGGLRPRLESIGELCRQATGSRPFAFLHADNASITRLVVLEDRRRLLRSFNDTAHLAALQGYARATPIRSSRPSISTTEPASGSAPS